MTIATASTTSQTPWDTEIFFPHAQTWEQLRLSVMLQFQDLARFKGQLTQGAAVLHEYLLALETSSVPLYDLYNYAHQRHLQNDQDAEANEMLSKIYAAFAEINTIIGFEAEERASITPEQFNMFLLEEPRLERWAFELHENRRLHLHALDAKREALVQQAIEAMQPNRKTYEILRFQEIQHRPVTDSNGQQLEVTPDSFPQLMRNPDRELRREVQMNFYGAIRKNQASLANVFLCEIKKHTFVARAKGFHSTLEAAVFSEHIPPTLPEQVLSSFDANIGVWHRYFELRRRILGVDSLAWYDFRVPLRGTGPSISYDQAVKWIVAAMNPLGNDYCNQLEAALTSERWVDAVARPGRSSVTAAYTAYGSKPRVVVSYNNDLGSVSRLAHEIGHAMHFKAMSDHQPVHYAHQAQRLASEVAANFHQAMLRRYLLEHEHNPELHLAVLEEELEFFFLYFLYMPTLTKLELAMHERVWNGSGLSANWIGEQCKTLFKQACGPALGLEDDLDLTWTTAGVLLDQYYAFQYLPGFAGGEQIASLIHQGQHTIVAGYLEFISKGLSMPQLEALRLTGIDFASPQTIEAGFATLSDRIDRLERLLG
jgi:oligoendopeptidase F